jgi:hypothetical protein
MKTATYICSECGKRQDHPDCEGPVHMLCRHCSKVEFFFYSTKAAKEYWENRIVTLKLLVRALEKNP